MFVVRIEIDERNEVDRIKIKSQENAILNLQY